MKTINSILTCVLTFATFISYSQSPIFVYEDKKEMSQGEQPAYIVDIPHADYNKIEKAWIKLIEEGTKIKSEKINNEIVIIGAVKEEITSNPINIYSKVYAIDTAVRLVNFFEIDSVFLYHPEHGTHEEEIYLSVVNTIHDFAVEQYRDIVTEHLKGEMDILADLEKEYDQLVKEKEKLQKSIRSNEQDIERSNDIIEECDLDIESVKGEIEDQKEIVSLYKKGDPEKKDQAEAALKATRKTKKRLEKSKEKELKKIVSYESNIIEAEREIKIVEKEQEMQLQKIEAQKELVNKIGLHLDSVK
jgi:hypothetical protein